MMAQASDIVLRFLFNPVEEPLIERGIGAAGEQEILPDGQAEFIAEIEKVIRGKIGASPHPHHVHMDGGGIAQQGFPSVSGRPGGIGQGRNPVAAFHKERNTIAFELEGLAPFVGFPDQ